jgi:hypothetical protein
MAHVLFNPHAAQAARAVQAWQILVGRAMNRQTVTTVLLTFALTHVPGYGGVS